MSSANAASMASALVPEAMASWFSGPSRDTGGGGFIEHEKATNKLLRGVQEVDVLREVVLSALSADAASSEIDADVHLLVPQSVTLDEVDVTQELVETHLVLLQRGVHGQPRGFRSLNGLCGTCQPDDTVVVHGRRPRAAGAHASWNFGSRGTVPQLEVQIHILREAQLPGTEKLPLRSPLPLLLISDPLFYPGCGWKLSLALDLVTHRFAGTELANLGLADVPHLLFEYQILARAWWQLQQPPPEAKEEEPQEPPKQQVVVDQNNVVWVSTPQPPTPASKGALAPSAPSTPQGAKGNGATLEPASPVAQHAGATKPADASVAGLEGVE